jgi:pyruvate-ferredoxin/flavodoxin oxidoreductase
MGSNCETLKEVIDYLGEQGEKVGMIQVHLYRPFSAKHFLAELPKTVKQITVLDRTKEPGATGEPLYNDVRTVLDEAGMKDIQILGGRYGLSSKDTIPAHMKAVYDNMKGECKNHFVTGINDDLTNHSLPIGENIVTADKSTISCKFFGIGSDGTVGANKNSMKIIGDHTDKYVQAYFQYDSKKSGGLTRSHIRFGDNPIRSEYYVTAADFLGCHKQSYVNTYDLIREIREGGTFLLNTHWTGQELIDNLDNRTKRQLAQKHIKFYTINASGIAEEIGLGTEHQQFCRLHSSSSQTSFLSKMLLDT